jgi:hypothetical protein
MKFINNPNKLIHSLRFFRDEIYEVCPFNNTHVILRQRFPFHVVKCQKSYMGPKLKFRCNFNQFHMFHTEHELNEHMIICYDSNLNHDVVSTNDE